MTEPRLASKLQISSLIRLTELAGGFGAILHKGDPISGAILLIVRIRGAAPVLYERFPTVDGTTRWQDFPQKGVVSESDMNERLKKQPDRDADLWVIELDVPDDERLADILAAQG